MNKIILACLFAFLAITVTAQDKKTVTLDYFYNNEYQTKDGKTNRFHYTWEDKAMTGYSKWGEMFKQKGAALKSLTVAPTKANLAGTDVYIITDPDTKKETANPNFVDRDAIKAIKKWVKAGGTLVLLANDSVNCELPHFNKLANVFGINFNDKIRNAVEKDLSVGLIVPEAGNEIFKTAKNLFLKGISTISVSKNAKALITDKGDVIMATARYGKGKVFAAGDPWIYNEYIDNDILNTYKGNTIVFENNKAAEELTTWLLLD
ncbi:DUF4350 domain-containing protein [Pedobacter glucosidilyticus]|uniref:DUF4350 domain-containing protein n=1 Tax=Pedobacter glucosidilyticus TaxID=1122941 RepID=UPI0026F078A7|nr:DUF4350 domain-containing protein [Pedobacter glucosidilyticus]